jgi:phosphoglycerate kinase
VGMKRFHKRTLREVPLEGTTVLVRADYNVPLTKDGKIHDDFRIRASLPTIDRLLKDGCKVVIISHLGRPEGRTRSLSLRPVALRLAELLEKPVRFVDDCVGEKVRMSVKKAPKDSVTLLENLRFYEQEEANDETFAKQLAISSGARYFVQDGFGVVHRAHSSTAAITSFLPSVAGLLLEREYVRITEAIRRPDRPLVAVMGGAKVSDKIDVIGKLVEQADRILIGGAMANTFLKYKGVDVADSKYEDGVDETIDSIYAAVEAKVGQGQIDTFLALPTDVAVAKANSEPSRRHDIAIEAVETGDRILDIGAATIESFTRAIKEARTVIWNGTMGYAEDAEFAHGSARVALALATQPETISVIGGGDTADFVLNWDARHGESFTHVSTGGGASLELMAGESLPGIEHLLDA